MAPVIEFQEVSIAFGRQQVLRNVNFRVNEGETKIILGGSGQGKSTILRLVLGLEKPDRGKILIQGVNISALSEEELVPIRKQMGMVFQESSLFDSLSVYENISYRLHEEEEHSEEEIFKITRQLLHRVDLEEGDLEKLPIQLSGGMKRRVAIARAMAGVHRIMLYDEPTAGLDPITGRHITELIIRLRDLEGVSALVVTQDVISGSQIITQCAHRDSSGISVGAHPDHKCTHKTSLLILRDGHILAEGRLEQLLQSSDSYIQEFLSTLRMIAAR